MEIKPVHGCYTPHQFHHYVITGERFANDNSKEWAVICERRREVEQLTGEDAIKQQLISAWGRVIHA